VIEVTSWPDAASAAILRHRDRLERWFVSLRKDVAALGHHGMEASR
jgi:hypothetical protein